MCIKNTDQAKFKGNLFSKDSLALQILVEACDAAQTPGKCKPENEIREFFEKTPFYFLNQ